MVLLEITLSNSLISFIIFVIALIFFGLYIEIRTKNKKVREFEIQQKADKILIEDRLKEESTLIFKLREQELLYLQKEAQIKLNYQDWALTELEKYKQAEIHKIRKEIEEQSLTAASVALQKWKIESEGAIRQDAINKSYSVNMGKITEHLIPFHHSFLSQFNPKDARFLGSPIDLVVFDGYADKKSEIMVYFVEIKTGKSKLTDIQKRIKSSILKGNVRWAEINPDQQKQITIEYEDQKLKPITNPGDLKKINQFFDNLKITSF